MTYVVVGAGLAGAKAVETLRAEGYQGPITLFGTEDELPYERPPLSKGLLLGSDDSPFVHTAQWYTENDIDFRRGVTVTSISPAGKTLKTNKNEEFAYDRLLLATGSSPRPLDVPGGDRALLLRTLGDSKRIDEAVREGTRLVVVGSGWIGLEVAAAARTRGAEVTVVSNAELPLEHVLGAEIAAVFADLHRSHGVTFVPSATVTEVTAEGVVLADGTTLQADVVVAGIGVTPNIGLAADAGLAVDHGVLVDAKLTTSDPDIFAAGDIAAVDHPVLHHRIRVEHWATALNGGPVAAKAMLGQDVAYDDLPYFFTDQFDLGMEYVGWYAEGTPVEVAVRGDLATREFIAFWLADGRVVAGMNVNVWDVVDDVKALILSGRQVDRARLTNPAIDLKNVLTAA